MLLNWLHIKISYYNNIIQKLVWMILKEFPPNTSSTYEKKFMQSIFNS